MKKVISLFLVFSLCTTMLIGCGTKKDAVSTTEAAKTTEVAATTTEKADEVQPLVTKPTEITFAYAGGDPLIKELTSARVQKFNAENENVTVIEMPSGSGAYLDFLKTQDAIGEFPDMLDSRDTNVWVDADKLAELPESVVALVADAPLFNGKNYVAPISNALPSIGIYYNKKIFTELGIEEPKTYAEFEALCEKIKASGVAPLVQGGKDVWHMGFLWSQFWNEKVFANNPTWLADKRAGKVSFTDANVQEMLTKYHSLYTNEYIDKGWLSTADNQIVSFLIAEKAAMFFSGSWMITQVMEADPSFELGWFPLPDESGNINLTYGPALAGYALSQEAAKDPNKVAVFEAFLKFWYDEDNYTEYLQKGASAPSTDLVVTYDNPLLAEFNVALENATFTDIAWNGKWGDEQLPGGFRNFAYKAFQETVGLGSNIMELGELLDKQWDVEIEQTK